MADEENIGSRYAYLLQPIKDLEKNFDINIAALLEEYVEKLEAVAEAENFRVNNAHKFNFAEAAILIQGTANVFSRKVDLVYNSAMNFFEVMRTANEKKKKKKDNDSEDEGFDGGDDVNESLAANPVDPCDLQNLSKLKPVNPATLVSKSIPIQLPRIYIMPMSLMPLADFEKCNVPIYNPKNKNEVVGKKDDYKINTGYISKQGALLLDLKNEVLENYFRDDPDAMVPDDSGRITPSDDPAIEMTFGFVPQSQSQKIEIARQSALARPSSVFLGDRRPTQTLAPLIEDDFDDGGCGGFEDNDIPIIPPPPKRKPWEVTEDDYFDTRDLQDDPFAPSLWKNRPFKEGNNCMNINSIIGKRKKAEEKKEHRDKVMETIEFVNDQIYCMGKKQKKRRELGLGTQYKWEIDAILPYISAQQKRREKQRREMVAKRKAKENRRRSTHKVEKITTAISDQSDDDFIGGGYDDYVAEDGERFIGADSLHREKIANVDDADLAGDLNFPEVCIEPATNTRGIPFEIQEHHNILINKDMTTGEIIAHYRKKYWEQTAEAMSKLAARVQEWDEKMQPLLEEEETRKEFDIHVYGDEMLSRFDNLSSIKSLPELLPGKKKYEISRYFLSTLMLANCMNLEIINEQQTGSDPLKMMSFKLLDRERHHKIFESEQGAL